MFDNKQHLLDIGVHNLKMTCSVLGDESREDYRFHLKFSLLGCDCICYPIVACEKSYLIVILIEDVIKRILHNMNI